MPAGPVRFGNWLFRLLAWDSLLPVAVALIPAVFQWLFPNNRGLIEIAAIALPIAGFFIRLKVGRRHVFTNNCTAAFRRRQFLAFFFGIFVLALLDGVIVLSYIMPQGALFPGTDEFIIWASMAGIYLCMMIFATYPGRDWTPESADWDGVSMHVLLDEIRHKIRPPPRQIGAWAQFWMRAWPLMLVRHYAQLMEIYRHQDFLLQEGMVVWGAIVQANGHLVASACLDGVGTVVYAPNRSFDNHPEALQSLGYRLFQLKISNLENPDERLISEILAGDMRRIQNNVVPKSLTYGKDVRCCALMVFSKHLPAGSLKFGWFPLLIHPETAAVMIVPAQYWPERLSRLWFEGYAQDRYLPTTGTDFGVPAAK